MVCVGPYEIIEELGRGGHALVYRVRGALPPRPKPVEDGAVPAAGRVPDELALKLLQITGGDRERIDQWFRHEYAALARIRHPRVVRVYDRGEFEGRPYFTMQFLAGGNLGEWFDRSANQSQEIPTKQGGEEAELRRILAQVCDGLACIHEQKLVHRDLKPSNVLLDTQEQALVADLGLARQLDPEVTATLSLTQGFVGTPAFAAPEQIRYPTRVGPQSDLYAVGVMLYLGLAKRLPFIGETALDTLLRTLEEEPRRPGEERRVDPDLERLALWLLRKDPQERPNSAQEVASLLRGEKEILGAVPDRPQSASKGDKSGGTETPDASYISLPVAGRRSVLAAAFSWLRERRHSYSVLLMVAAAAAVAVAVRGASLWGGNATEQDQEPELRRLNGLLGTTLEEATRLREDLANAGVARYWPKAPEFVVHLAKQDSLSAELWRVQDRIDSLETRLFALVDSTSGSFRNEQLLLVAAEKLIEEAGNQRNLASSLRWTEVARTLGMEPSPAKLVGSSVPPARQAWLLHAEQGGDTDTLYLGPAPWELTLPNTGPHTLVVAEPGWAALRWPFLALPGVVQRLDLQLIPADSLGKGMIVIPAGSYIRGGDRAVEGGLAPHNVQLSSFAIGELPVSVGEYLEFVRDLDRHDPRSASFRLPKSSVGSPPIWVRGEAGRIERVDTAGDIWPAALPMVQVDAQDARAYALWLSEKEGKRYRLPNASEWEKVARGGDRRSFPWGDVPASSRANTAPYASAEQRPDAIERFALKAWHPTAWGCQDESPFGVIGMAGGVREWCRDGPVEGLAFGRTADSAWIRGGDHLHGWERSRISTRELRSRREPSPAVGFRLVQELG